MSETQLKRRITLIQLIFYGVGTIIGAGIFALTGKVAGEAGMATPLAFLLAGMLAFLNAFTFAELSARLPYSAGEARYVLEAFKREWLSVSIGVLVITTGVVAAAALSVAAVGFLQAFIAIPTALGIVVLVMTLGLINIWGVGESVFAVNMITVISLLGLAWVVYVGGEALLAVPERLPEMVYDLSAIGFVGLFSGAFLGFYAFIGFEDLVNMAEEVKDVRRTMPLAIMASVSITTLIYVLVSLVAVMNIAPDELALAHVPFATVVSSAGTYSERALQVISLLVVLNSALVQIVMASRVVYGLGKRSRRFQWLAHVHPKTQTPIKASALILVIILLFALFFPLITLAKITSTAILFIFAILNLALLWIKRRGDPAPECAPNYPSVLIMVAFFACISVLLFNLWLVMSDV